MSILSDYWNTFQVSLFPHLETVLEEPRTQKLERFIYILDVVGIEKHVASPFSQWMGRKQSDRRSIARAFLAKAVYDHATRVSSHDSCRSLLLSCESCCVNLL